MYSLSEDGYLGRRATDRRDILHDGRCGSRTGLLSFIRYPLPPQKKNPEISVENISKTVSRSVTCQMGRNIGPRAFQKCIAWDGSPQGESPIRKMCIFGPGTDISGRST